MVACLIAGGCAAGFIAIWFVTIHKELAVKRRNLASLRKQLLLHEAASAQIRDGPNSSIAANMLETNRRVYREAVRGYNQLLKKPLNWLPAYLMGFRCADEFGNIREDKQ